jgi:hypothetical protein
MHDDQTRASRGIINGLLLTAAALAVSALLVGSAFATSGGEGNNTQCQGQGNPNSPCVPGSTGTPGTTIGGQGGLGGSARSQARASARATAVGVGVGIGRGGAASATGGNASATQNVTVQGGGSGGGTYVEARERQRVPDANAPAIWSNNPCLVGLSGGVAVAGFGASFGAGVEDRDCTRRANAQHLVAMGEREAAREVLCESAEVRAAFARIGRPCAADVRPVAAAPAPAPREVIGGGARPARPAYCATLLARGMITAECQ